MPIAVAGNFFDGQGRAGQGTLASGSLAGLAEMLRAPPCRMCILPAASRFARFSFIRYSDWIKGYLKRQPSSFFR
jgi:hypothetical protein